MSLAISPETEGGFENKTRCPVVLPRDASHQRQQLASRCLRRCVRAASDFGWLPLRRPPPD